MLEMAGEEVQVRAAASGGSGPAAAAAVVASQLSRALIQRLSGGATAWSSRPA